MKLNCHKIITTRKDNTKQLINACEHIWIVNIHNTHTHAHIHMHIESVGKREGETHTKQFEWPKQTFSANWSRPFFIFSSEQKTEATNENQILVDF